MVWWLCRRVKHVAYVHYCLLSVCACGCVNVCEYEAALNSCKRSAQCHLCVHNVRSATMPHKKGFALWICVHVRVCLCQFIVALWMPFASLFFEGKPTNLICINASTCFINGILKPHEMGLLCRLLAFFHNSHTIWISINACVCTQFPHMQRHKQRKRERERGKPEHAAKCIRMQSS